MASLMGKSLNDTLFTLLRQGHSQRATNLKSAFKVPDNRWWMIRLRALVAQRAWDEIEEWVNKTGRPGKAKSPIGWEPFVREVLGAKNLKLAATLVERIMDKEGGYQKRVEWWIQCGHVVRAAEEAMRYKDQALVDQVRKKAPEHERAAIERALEQLGRR